MKGPKINVYTGIFCISCSALLLEIALTRILSVSHWYHYAFMVISLALLGFGASGTLLSLIRTRIVSRPVSWMVLFCCLFSVSSITCYRLFEIIGFEEILFSWHPSQLGLLGLSYLVLSIPFLFAGCAIGTAVSSYTSKIGPVYFSNLAGSALGCALVIPAFAAIGGTNVILAASAIGLLAAAILSFPRLKKEGILIIIGLLFLLLRIGQQPALLPLGVSEFKACSMLLNLPDASVEDSRWNAISRVDVIKSRYIRIAPGGMSLMYDGRLPEQLALTIDGDSPSPINKCTGGMAGLSFLDYSPASLPYRLAGERPGVLIIGPGGGSEVWCALRNGAGRVTAVEVNPIVVDMVKEKYGAYAGGVFSKPGVEIVVDEGRSYARGTDDTFDIVSITLLDSLAAASAGVYSLSENYLYTTEALCDFYRLLSDRGVISITRWLKIPPTDSIKLFSTAISALGELGVPDPGAHLAFTRSWSTGTVLISKQKLSGDAVKAIEEFCAGNSFDIVHVPGMKKETANRHNVLERPYYSELAAALLTDFDGTIAGYPFDISPPTDDRPFFYNAFKLESLPYLLPTMGTRWLPFVEWGYLVLVASLAQSLIFSAIIIILPLLLIGRSPARSPKVLVISYFALIGIAFMAIEISMIQRFILFLGHPAYSMAVILAGILISCGAGSYAAGKVPEAGIGRRLRWAIFAVSGLAVTYSLGLPPLFAALKGIPLAQRVVITLLLIFPLGFPMGFPFPLGIRSFARRHPRLVPIAWGANGCASVVGAILAVVLAISMGFALTTIFAAALYLAAAACGRVMCRGSG
ncbi:MAG: hypothetical protein P9M00_12590 [Candidatus Tritonobacter lacicola]|nr:hypothetical protein [Candidatus Tritonobacter lacicola]